MTNPIQAARDMLIRAAERAASLGANAEAQRSLSMRPSSRTGVWSRRASWSERDGWREPGARRGEATSIYERSIALFESQGATHPAARVFARLAEIMWIADDSARAFAGWRRLGRCRRRSRTAIWRP